MRIESLKLKNFINHNNLELALDHINVIAGPNNMGKTAILNAIEWLVGGRSRNMDMEAKVIDRQYERKLIKTDAAKAEVEAIISNGKDRVKFYKSLTPGGSLTIKQVNHEGTKNIAQNDILNWFHTDERKILNSLNGYNSLNLAPQQRKEFVFNLLGIALNEEMLKKHLSAKGVEEPLLNQVITRILDSNFPTALKWAEEERRKHNTRSWTLAMEPENKIVTYNNKDMKISELNLEEIDKVISEKQASHNQLSVKIGEMNSSKSSATEILQKRCDINARIAELDEFLNKKITVDEQNSIIEDYNKKLRIIKASINMHYNTITTLKTQIRAIDQQLGIIESLGECCPICGTKLTKEKIENLINEQKKLKSERENELTGSQATWDKSQEDMRKHEKQYEDAIRLLPEIESKTKLRESLETQLQELNSKSKKVKSSDDINTEINKIQDQISELEIDMTYLRELKDQVKTYQFHKSNWKNQQESISESNAKWQEFDRLVNLLRPDGIINDILKNALDDFSKYIDYINRPVNGKKLLPEIQLDKTDFTFKVGSMDEDMLSRYGSERQRLSYILSAAIAHFAGSRIWICDELDKLDDENRKTMLRIAHNLMGDFDTIILLMTRNEPIALNGIQGMKSFWLGK